jgi:hypothetical protein
MLNWNGLPTFTSDLDNPHRLSTFDQQRLPQNDCRYQNNNIQNLGDNNLIDPPNILYGRALIDEHDR